MTKGRFSCFLAACCILSTIPAPAADLPAAEPPRPAGSWLRQDEPARWQRNLFRRFVDDQRFLVTEWWPAESRRSSFSAPLALAIAGASLGGRPDLRLERSISSSFSGGGREAAERLTTLGDAPTALALIGGTYLVSRLAGNVRMQRATSLSAEALMSSAVYSTLLKRAARRVRPAGGGTGEFFVSSPETGQENSSFPSGHAMGAFAVATVFSREYRDRRWVPWVAYGTAGLIGASRVGLGRHFVTDVVAGAIVGTSLGRMVAERDTDEDEAPPSGRFGPTPGPDGEGIGLRYQVRW